MRQFSNPCSLKTIMPPNTSVVQCLINTLQSCSCLLHIGTQASSFKVKWYALCLDVDRYVLIKIRSVRTLFLFLHDFFLSTFLPSLFYSQSTVCFSQSAQEIFPCLCLFLSICFFYNLCNLCGSTFLHLHTWPPVLLDPSFCLCLVYFSYVITGDIRIHFYPVRPLCCLPVIAQVHKVGTNSTCSWWHQKKNRRKILEPIGIMHECTWLLWKRSCILPQGHNLPLPPSLSQSYPPSLWMCVCVCVSNVWNSNRVSMPRHLPSFDAVLREPRAVCVHFGLADKLTLCVLDSPILLLLLSLQLP